jgi:hypothetical protein
MYCYARQKQLGHFEGLSNGCDQNRRELRSLTQSRPLAAGYMASICFKDRTGQQRNNFMSDSAVVMMYCVKSRDEEWPIGMSHVSRVHSSSFIPFQNNCNRRKWTFHVDLDMVSNHDINAVQTSLSLHQSFVACMPESTCFADELTG